MEVDEDKNQSSEDLANVDDSYGNNNETWQDIVFDKGMMPELTKRSLAVDEWLPQKNPKKKQKKKSKAKLRKEREEKTLEALSMVAERLNSLLNADIETKF